MYSTFVRCREEDIYQQRLAFLLAYLCRRPEILTVVPPNLMALPKGFVHLYYVFYRSYWAREFFFRSRVRVRQKIFGGYHNIELFSVKSPDRVKHGSDFPSWWMKYEPPTLLFVPSLFCWPTVMLSL